MIAPASAFPSVEQRIQSQFEKMLPDVKRHILFLLRKKKSHRDEETVQECVASCFVAFARLVRQGREHKAFPSVLARYAVAQYHAGRRVGCKLSIRDVSSPYAQRKKKFRLERLERFDPETNAWREAVVNDPHTPVFHQVWFRLDFPVWLARLERRDRRVALALARGDTTGETAKRFDLSPARVSQLRRELSDSWHEFHADKRVLEEAVPA